ncbi:MAG: hypothetical protein K8M05_03985 [Deltaproteobacteria bacterium]|nr:hypothetical protein [Kofleriaceae bacterium]
MMGRPHRRLAAILVLVTGCCKPSGGSGPPTGTVGAPAAPRRATELADLIIGTSGACGVFDDRSAACWGVWDGSLFSVTTPAFTLREVVELRGGHALTDPQRFVHHFCARDAGGAVWCWGNNHDGQVGRGNHEDAATPDRVPIEEKVVGLALGMRHTCALTESGAVWCWGANQAGQVSGPGETVVSPRRVEGVAGVTRVVAMNDSTCALTQEHGLLCWGFPYGSGPRELEGARGTVRLGDGSAPSCSIMDEGRVQCWASLHDLVGPEHAQAPFVRIAGVPRSTMVASGSTHACAVSEDGEVWCWGRGGEGELGTGRAEPAISPPVRVDLPAPATRIVVAHHNTCARLDDRRWFCWGRNVGGMFGPQRPVLAPVALDLGQVTFTAK